MKSAIASIKKAIITYQAPSNIAFIKYWGKRDRQIPLNASLSMTLDQCYTQTSISFYPLEKDELTRLDFSFESHKNLDFQKRIEKYLNAIEDLIPWLKYFRLEIKSHNNFPHSAGIASSASSFASIAACLEKFSSVIEKRSFSIDKASSMARIGSGSAARSFKGPYMLWGKHSKIKQSDDHYAISFNEFHPIFDKLCNSVLLVDSQAKKISSSQGHILMNTHLFKEARIQQAMDNLSDLTEAMRNGDFKQFGNILEQEALSLHAMMMTSYPSYLLLKPNSLAIIEAVRSFRKESGKELYFTIDAGPNIHLIYPEKDKKSIQIFIEDKLKKFCENNAIIHDQAGLGITEVQVEVQ